MTWKYKAFYGIFIESDLVDFLNKNKIKDFKVVKSHIDNKLVIVYKLPELTDQEEQK